MYGLIYVCRRLRLDREPRPNLGRQAAIPKDNRPGSSGSTGEHSSLSTCAKRSAGDDKLDPVHLAAGQVLTTKSVLTEWLSEESVDGGCFCFGGARRKHNPDNNKINRSGNSNSYMKVCHDDGSQLLLPYSTEGVLFEIGRRTDVSDEDAIYRLADVVRWRQLPVDLKLVRGQLPDVLADCTGLFRLHQLAVGGTISPSGGDGSDRQLVEFADDCESDILPRCKTWSTLPRLGDTNPVSPSKIGSQEEWTADIRGVEEAISWHHPKEDKADLGPGTALQDAQYLT
ncbi:hypothetical protein LSH36_145g05042 [Paralvinella palmiformis]|uniref:Uncharacterized protein n=1 Tax=Paralvinella palmiformis TaxID=53620 RepID=A0AAD9N7L9_9ANNE|nr:hypothetical protein LSH36_145g05042 [Paralvinella palmiformis]